MWDSVKSVGEIKEFFINLNKQVTKLIAADLNLVIQG
jgi:hypothetical protein